jgi:hypothetical protein
VDRLLRSSLKQQSFDIPTPTLNPSPKGEEESATSRTRSPSLAFGSPVRRTGRMTLSRSPIGMAGHDGRALAPAGGNDSPTEEGVPSRPCDPLGGKRR